MSTSEVIKMTMEIGEFSSSQENPIDVKDNTLIGTVPRFKERSISRKLKCAKCGRKCSSMRKLYNHKSRCKKSVCYKSFCWSCKKRFQFHIHLRHHVCTKSIERRRRNKELLRENLAKARGWVEEQKQKQATEDQKELSGDEGDDDGDGNEVDDIGDGNEVGEGNDVDDIITCSKCDEKFASAKSFEFHYIRGLCKPKESLCGICKKTFHDEDEFQFHEARCKDKQRVIAKLKQKQIELKRLKQKLKQNITFTCRSCKNKYYSPQQLKKHLDKHPYCTRIHNLKIKQRCMWERGDSLSKTARKSFHNYKKPSVDSYPIVKKLKQLKRCEWESESNTSVESFKKPVCGAARKSFPRPSSETKKGDFCDVCYRYFSSFTELKLHKQKHFQSKEPVKMNKCPQCPESFSDAYKLKVHQNAKDHWGKATKSITTTSACPFCAKEFTHLILRNAHLRSHINEFPVEEFMAETTCNICNEIFTSQQAKIQHVRLKHRKQPSPEVEVIGEQKSDIEVIFQSHKYVGYSNKNVLLNVTPDISQLLRKHPNQCPICHKKYSTSFIRNRHFRSHTLDQAFECKFCPTKFPRSDRLLQHMQSQHNDCLGYECKVCSLRFTTRMRALQHGNKAHQGMQAKNLIRERTVVNNSYQKKQSKYALTLAAGNRNEAIIPDEEFYCDVCELSFLKLCGLQRHKQSKLHKEILEKSQQAAKAKSLELLSERPPLSLTPPFIDYSKKFSCSSCSLEFDSVNDFVPHRLSHFSSPKPSQDVDEFITYVCEVCGKVMDNHQRIQLHLFWHLQDVQLQAGPKKPTPSKAGKGPVAKKSITKGTNKEEELVIAGVKKPLFTCDACKIGFITMQHYKIHIDQYCKSRKAAPQEKKTNKSVTAGFCKICGSIFSSSDAYEEHKTLFCNDNSFVTLNDNAESLYTEMVKSLMNLDSMVAGCVRCNLAFDSMKMLAEHSAQHIAPEEIDPTSVVLTQLEVSSPASAVEEKTIEATLTFDNEQNLLGDGQVSEPAKQEAAISMLEEDKSDLNTPDESMPVADHHATEKKSVMGLNVSASKPEANSSSKADGTTIFASNQDESLSNATDNADLLRANFTRLLCVLVSDQDLMDQLGYGKKPIDDVLVNVLDQMGLAPVPPEEECAELERLRRNIRILLDVCIKDQIMEFIANSEATTDSIVEAALKMFNAEDPLSVLEED